jgi:hypothetical protein
MLVALLCVVVASWQMQLRRLEEVGIVGEWKSSSFPQVAPSHRQQQRCQLLARQPLSVVVSSGQRGVGQVRVAVAKTVADMAADTVVLMLVLVLVMLVLPMLTLVLVLVLVLVLLMLMLMLMLVLVMLVLVLVLVLVSQRPRRCPRF